MKAQPTSNECPSVEELVASGKLFPASNLVHSEKAKSDMDEAEVNDVEEQEAV